MSKIFPGEFEQMVLLAVLQVGEDGYALAVRREIQEKAQRPVSRGALYRTLDRLEGKGFLAWDLEEESPERGGHPRRRFRVTEAGVAALRTSRQALSNLWDGLESVLGDKP